MGQTMLQDKDKMMTGEFEEHLIQSVKQDPLYTYEGRLEEIRRTEYAHLGSISDISSVLTVDTMYLDHAGATPYPISIVREHCLDLSSKLLSNPHSSSTSSMSTDSRIASIRLRVLKMFNADPNYFDIVFCANATAGVKLVAEGFAGSPNGFRYRYLRDVHTSLVGAGNLAKERQYMEEHQVNKWVTGNSKEDSKDDKRPGLFAYPAQTNFNGRRFPLRWISNLRENCPGWYSLLDAASYLTTTPLDFGEPSEAPDFTVMSFYKIFGYPDLGAVIVRKEVGQMLLQRQYFGGGSRAGLTVEGINFPRKILHEALEDGTLPFHTIMALGSALDVYHRLFRSQAHVAKHAATITRLAYALLWSLQYPNGQPLCQLYSLHNQGPIISFNLLSPNGTYMGYVAFEKAASARNFAIRTGGLCNPGGMQKYNDLSTEELLQMFATGKKKECGDGIDLIDGKVFGVIRLSFGACSTIEELVSFVNLLREMYIERRGRKEMLADFEMCELTELLNRSRSIRS